jgi:CheY-like chemotaxis protein
MAPTDDVMRESRPSLVARRILVVDADVAHAAQVRDILKSFDGAVDAARDGAEACAMIGRLGPNERYDAIIASVQLSDMTGVDLFLQLQKLLGHVPMVMVRGFIYDPAPLLAKAREAGLTHILHLPFRVEQLLDALEGLIKQSQ